MPDSPSAGAPPQALELPPPIYGRWPAAVTSVPLAHGKIRPWITELNLDPRNRAVAALGTLLVQRQQEQLMASAWAQVGPIDLANQALHQAQLARQAARATYDSRFRGLSSAAGLLMLAAPVFARVPGTGAAPSTLYAEVLKTRIAPAISPAFRRLGRRRGPLARRGGGATWPDSLLNRLNSDARVVVPQRRKPDGTEIAAIIGATQNAVLAGDPAKLHLDGPMRGATFQTVSGALQATLGTWTSRTDSPVKPRLDLRRARAQAPERARPREDAASARSHAREGTA